MSDCLCLCDPGIILDEAEILLNVLLKKTHLSLFLFGHVMFGNWQRGRRGAEG